MSVIFEQGMVVYADSTVRRLDDLLGNVLVRHGKIRKEVLEEALAKQKVSMQRLGFILTSQGYIERDDLKLALSEQVQQIVFRVFRWKTGDYHFEPLAEADYDRDNATPVSTDHILMEGIRRVDEWPIIEKRIPSLEFVFRPLVPIQQITVVESEPEDEGGLGAMFEGVGDDDDGDSSAPSSEVTLTPQEEKIYRVVDGKRSVAAIMEMTGTVGLRRLPYPVRLHRSQSRRTCRPGLLPIASAHRWGGEAKEARTGSSAWWPWHDSCCCSASSASR